MSDRCIYISTLTHNYGTEHSLNECCASPPPPQIFYIVYKRNRPHKELVQSFTVHVAVHIAMLVGEVVHKNARKHKETCGEKNQVTVPCNCTLYYSVVS